MERRRRRRRPPSWQARRGRRLRPRAECGRDLGDVRPPSGDSANQSDRTGQDGRHRKLIERLDLEALEQIPDERLLNSEIRAVVIELLREESTPLTVADREDIIEQVLYEITGLGPIEPLFRDLSISDILVNGSKEIYIERGVASPAWRLPFATTRTSWPLSTASSAGSAAAWTSPHRWLTPAFQTARA